jgi:threonyl-tRNA synthetase
MLACTVLELFPSVHLGGGGLLSYGFYYDFYFEQPIDETLIFLIETNLLSLAKEEAAIKYFEMTCQNAKSLLMHYGQPELCECIGDEGLIELVQIKKHYGICQAEELQTTEEVGVIKLLKFEQDEGKTRIIGTAFAENQTLKKFIKSRESYKKKNHLLLGVELNLLSFDWSVSQLQCYWHPRGEALRNFLKNWLISEIETFSPHQKISSPSILGSQDDYFLSPSPLIQHKSYIEKFHARRLFEWSSFFSMTEGEAEGLLTLQVSTGDFTSTCCFNEELDNEVISSLLFFEEIIKIFGFEAHWQVIASRQKSMFGRQESKILEGLQQVLEKISLHYPLKEDLLVKEDLAGPGIELCVYDELGRSWPLSSIVVVTQGKARLEKGRLVIQRAVLSFDRLIALLIERFEGNLPLWLAPEQVRILKVGEAVEGYVQEIEKACSQQGIRASQEKREIKLSEKIHWAEKEKIPYLILVGEQEMRRQTITLRSAKLPGKSKEIKLNDFFDLIRSESACPTIHLKDAGIKIRKGEFKLA